MFDVDSSASIEFDEFYLLISCFLAFKVPYYSDIIISDLQMAELTDRFTRCFVDSIPHAFRIEKKSTSCTDMREIFSI